MKALIWDLDGTLVDSYKIITRVAKDTLKPYHKISEKEIHEQVIRTSLSQFFKTMSEKLAVSLEMLYDRYHNFSNEVELSEYDLIKDAKLVLEALTEKGYSHFIYTHRGSSTYGILKHHNALHYFEDIITSDEGFKRKPEPDALLHLIHKHHLNKDEAYYIGDRNLDIQCGIRAGIHTIYFGHDNHHNADHHIKQLKELLSIF